MVHIMTRPMKARLVIVVVLVIGVTLLLAWTAAATGANMKADAPSFPYLGSASLNAANWGYTSAITFTPVSTIYLPLVSREYCICGRVTLNGTPAAGVTLDLRFFNGSSLSTLVTTTTGSDGGYSFTGVPSLAPGQKYYVRFLNPATTADGRLADWFTRNLTVYTAGTAVEIGNFDLADITLQSPPPDATISLPNTFQWTRRTATPTDSYEFNLFDPNGTANFYTIPPLGYVSSYLLNNLPGGFNINTPYGWFVAVYSPDGGYGESFYYRAVTFSNTGLSATTAARPLQLKTVPDLGDRRKR